jgi:putative ABC transport system permease protein
MTHRSQSRLGWLASLLVRGPHAGEIGRDLEDLFERDIGRGASAWRARLRYLRRAVASAVSIWRARVATPSLPMIQWLDLKLAIRLLLRHPGLTIVGGLALAIGIPIGLAPLHLVQALSRLPPIPDADRVIGIEHRDLKTTHDARPAVDDYERWRDQLTAFETLAAARSQTANVAGDAGLVDIVRGADVTASMFTVVRASAQLGRTLVESDHRKAADPVVVIGDGLWQRYFNRAPDAIGRTLQIGRVQRTIVGVMPAGFLLPYRDQFWVPLQARAVDYGAGLGPKLWIFGRLREGASLDQAAVEAETVGLRIAAELPDTHGHLRPDLLPYTALLTDLTPSFSRTYPAFLLSFLLLLVACGNVGTLTLARVAARTSEITVRHALGAGRARIVAQLFVESFVLASVAAAIGLLLGELAIRRLARMEAALPYWIDLQMTPLTMAAAVGLAVLSAVIAGVVPALKATSRRRSNQLLLRQGTESSLRFGAVSTMLIVGEVAIAVGGLTGAASVARGAFRDPALGDIAASEYLTTTLRLVPTDGSPAGITPDQVGPRLGAVQEDLARRLLAEPGVRAVSFATHLPGMEHGRTAIEMEETGQTVEHHLVDQAFVDQRFFAALDQQVMGRDFADFDLARRPRPVIVNRSFVDKVLGGRSPIGRRLRHVTVGQEGAAPWRDVIGVVDDLGTNIVDPDKAAAIYHVIAPGQIHPLQLLVRVAGDPSAFEPRLRAVLITVEPGLLPNRATRLDEVFNEQLWQARFTSIAFAAIAAMAVVLSAAGLYALIAFSVSQRTREIAIRAALGARPGVIVKTVLRRALLQLVAGVAIGAWLASVIVPEVTNTFTLKDNWQQMLVVVSAVMVAIGLLACVSPVRRAMRIDPVQALRD